MALCIFTLTIHIYTLDIHTFNLIIHVFTTFLELCYCPLTQKFISTILALLQCSIEQRMPC